MASKQPFVKQIAWISLIPQLGVGAVLCGVMFAIGAPVPIVTGVVAYLLLWMGIQLTVLAQPRRAIRLLKRKDFVAAIPELEEIYAFFTRHLWIDKYRYLTLLVSSRMSYREMALINLAYCHAQNGNGAKSKEYYQRALDEFPDSEIAQSALKMFEVAAGMAQPASGTQR